MIDPRIEDRYHKAKLKLESEIKTNPCPGLPCELLRQLKGAWAEYEWDNNVVPPSTPERVIRTIAESVGVW